ncbi:hypothetical protein M1N90_01320 [Dehalococcoidia bacterium]|nr:hypothetical protein [Dehalococcoidia bacterium]
MVSEESLQALIGGLLSGDRRSLSKLISIVESNDASVEGIYPSIKDRLGKAEIIGITLDLPERVKALYLALEHL